MEYYVSINNEKRGPYNLEELRSRGITNETLIMADDGQEKWQVAWQMEELRPIIRNSTAEAPSETKLSQDDASIPKGTPVKTEMSSQSTPRNDYTAEIPVGSPIPESHRQPNNQQPPYSGQPPYQQEPPKKKSHFGCLVTLLLLVILIVAMVFTCPDSQRHKEVVTQVMTISFNDMAEQKDDADLITQGIRIAGDFLVGNLAETAIDQMLTVDNYFVCSVGNIHYEGKDHVISIGLFGHVFTLNKDDVTRAAEKYYKNVRQEAEQAIKKKIQEEIVDPFKDRFDESVINPIDDILGGLFNELMDGIQQEPSEPNAPAAPSESDDSSTPSEPAPSESTPAAPADEVGGHSESNL